MSTKKDDKIKDKDKNKKGLQPDPETLHTTDPQENMKGPVSSVMQNIKDEADDNDESKESADRRKDKNL